MKLRIATLSFTILLCLALSAPAMAQIVYAEGNPGIDGNSNAFFIDGPNVGPFSQSISNGFVASGSASNLNTLEFGEWVFAGTTPTTVAAGIGTSAFDNSLSVGTYAINSGNSSLVCTNGSPHNGGTCAGGFGYDVYDVTLTINSAGSLTSGSTYWVSLGNANDSGSTQFDGWDVPLGGAGGPATCNFSVGTPWPGGGGSGCGLGGESFTLGGPCGAGKNAPDCGPPTPEPSSIMLFGSGALGLVGVLRRKLY